MAFWGLIHRACGHTQPFLPNQKDWGPSVEICTHKIGQKECRNRESWINWSRSQFEMNWYAFRKLILYFHLVLIHLGHHRCLEEIFRSTSKPPSVICHTEVCLTFLRLAAKLSEMITNVWGPNLKIQRPKRLSASTAPAKYFKNCIKSLNFFQGL